MRKRMKQWAKTVGMVLAAGVLLSGAAGCSPSAEPEVKEPVNLTLWHVYGGQTDSPLNDMIGRFNRTVGREKNIYVEVTSVTNTNTIHEQVLSAAAEEPGAPDLPDLFVSYPKTVLALPDENILVDYRDYFTEEELQDYIPEFLQEGTVHDRLVVFPAAKSTEILFINQTAFDRFAAETGVKAEDLDTWEGLFRTAEIYADWTDSKTPETAGDGQSMFVHDYYFDYFQVGTLSLGEEFFEGDRIRFSPAFERAAQPLVRAALKGGVWLKGGYATESLRTGDSIVSLASSAGVLYYSDVVTYRNNESEKIEIVARPCPHFEGGDKLVMQRGAGFCTVKSTPEREQAAVEFLKWLTEPERNVELVTSLGYMPVTGKAFTDYLPAAIDGLEDPRYRSLYRAFLDTQAEYRFYTAPQIDSYLELETNLESQVRHQLSVGRRHFAEAEAGGLPEQEALQQSMNECVRELGKSLNP